VLWQVSGLLLNKILISTPSEIVSAFVEILLTGQLIRAFLGSAAEMAVGFTLACVLGISLGVVMGRWKTAERAVDPLVSLGNATPTIALVPFVSVTLGFAFWPKVLVAVLVSIFPILFGVMQGARSIPPVHLDVAAMFGSNERQLWRDVSSRAGRDHAAQGKPQRASRRRRTPTL